MLALLLLVGACGGDDDERGRGTTAGGDDSGESVSGSISVIGVWTGAEQKSFQAVIDGFTEKNPDVTVKYTSGGDNIADRALDRGRGRQPAGHRDRRRSRA